MLRPLNVPAERERLRPPSGARDAAVRAAATRVSDGDRLQRVVRRQRVAGLVHGQEEPKWGWVQDLVPGLRLIQGDLLDLGSLLRALAEHEPDVVFNLGALSFVGTSWAQPLVTAEVTGLGCLRMLEAIRLHDPAIRFVQASSSEMFGNAGRVPLGLQAPFRPYSPYAFAKVLAHHATVNYRESYGMHASNGMVPSKFSCSGFPPWRTIARTMSSHRRRASPQRWSAPPA